MALFISQAGYYFIYLFQQHELKEKAKEQLLSLIPENQLEVIDLTANQKNIQWEEEGKEFYLHGQLFDVARLKKDDGKHLAYCLNDKKEEQLLKELSDLIKTSNEQTGNKDGKQTIKFQVTDMIAYIQRPVLVDEIMTEKYSLFNDTEVASEKEVKSPPPKNSGFKSLNFTA